MDLDGWRSREYLGGVGGGEAISEYMEKFYFQLKNSALWTEPVGTRMEETPCPLTSVPFHCFTVDLAFCIWSKVKLSK